MRVVACWILPAWVLAGCTGDLGSTYTARDSAGVQIVESHAPAWPQPWRLAAAPAVEIGVVDGPAEYQFSAIVSAFQLPDGTLVVANRNPPQLRVYDAAGQYLRSIGRLGSGPGEFRLIFSADRLHDTLRVYDPMNSRISLFNVQGDLLSAHQIGAGQPSPATMFILFPGGRDGSFLARSNAPSPATDGPGRQAGRSKILLADRTGVVLDTIASIDDGEFEVLNGRRGLVLFSARAAALPLDSLIYVGSGMSFAIDVYHVDGRLLRRMRRDYAPRPINEPDIAAFIEQQLASAPDPRMREARAQSMKDRSAASHMPAHDMTFVADHERNLWVKGYQAPGDETVAWSVFAPAGQYLGDVAVPAAFRILAVEARGAIGVWKDDLDVERLRVWPLEKPDRP
jgi:hypothetical protein